MMKKIVVLGLRVKNMPMRESSKFCFFFLDYLILEISRASHKYKQTKKCIIPCDYSCSFYLDKNYLLVFSTYRNKNKKMSIHTFF